MVLPFLASWAISQTVAPAVGDIAPSFTLRSIQNRTVRLTPLLKQGPVVLVVLRGFPGYQCPFCSRQVGEFIAQGSEFEKRKASVVFVYPATSDKISRAASDFARGKSFPRNFHFTLDPDYRFTNRYSLRWDAPNETAYPSTFVIRPGGKISFAKVSREHGGRTSASEVLAALDKS